MESTSEILESLRDLPPLKFEEFIAALWERNGYKARTTRASGDGGVDVYATTTYPYNRKIAIQAKRYAAGQCVGVKDVRACAGITLSGNIDEMVLVTTSDFSDTGRTAAEELNVKLVNGEMLAHIVTSWGAADLVESYAAETETSTGGEDDLWTSDVLPRSDIPGDDDDRVALFPASRESIENILKEYSAWGAVKMASEAKYIAVYESANEDHDGQVRYISRYEEQLPVETFEERYDEDYSDEEWYEPEKDMVLVSDPVELEDPLPYSDSLARAKGNEHLGKLPSLRYVTLEGIREAEGTDDLLCNYKA